MGYAAANDGREEQEECQELLNIFLLFAGIFLQMRTIFSHLCWNAMPRPTTVSVEIFVPFIISPLFTNRF